MNGQGSGSKIMIAYIPLRKSSREEFNGGGSLGRTLSPVSEKNRTRWLISYRIS